MTWHHLSLFSLPCLVGARGGGSREQVQADPRHVRLKDKNRDYILDQLANRVLDVSPYVR